MNKFLITLAAGSVLAGAVPAFAADQVVSGRDVSIDMRIANLETRLQDGISSGRIERADARQLRKQIVRLDQMAASYKSDGLNLREQDYLRYQINQTRQQLQHADGSSGYAMWRDNDSNLGRWG